MYLVTGGCGFIGSHLVELLLTQGHRVRVLDDLSNSTKKNLSPQAEFLLGSIADGEIMQRALEGVEGVFHLAAVVSVPESITHWHKAHLINCGGAIRLFERAVKLPIVYASSAAVYGDSAAIPLNEKAPTSPLSPYAVDKLACEMHAQVAWHLHRTPSTGCRFFNVYGPRQNPYSPYSGVISKFSAKIARKEPLTIYGDGNQQRDFIFVKDVAQMLLKAMETLNKGAHIYNFCTGRAHSINELADVMGEIVGVAVKKEYAPPRLGDIRFSLGDPAKTSQELGLKASTPLEKGLRECLMAFPQL
jgi:UDP-glucose 4-epimerase